MVDSAGHGHGPDSPQAHAALAEVDAAIGRLRAGLVERGLLDRTNLVIVSDHGMATVAPEHAVAIEDMVSRDEATVVAFGQSVGIAPNPGFEARSEEHTSELQSLMRISYAVFCLKKKNTYKK